MALMHRRLCQRPGSARAMSSSGPDFCLSADDAQLKIISKKKKTKTNTKPHQKTNKKKNPNKQQNPPQRNTWYTWNYNLVSPGAAGSKHHVKHFPAFCCRQTSCNTALLLSSKVFYYVIIFFSPSYILTASHKRWDGATRPDRKALNCCICKRWISEHSSKNRRLKVKYQQRDSHILCVYIYTYRNMYLTMKSKSWVDDFSLYNTSWSQRNWTTEGEFIIWTPWEHTGRREEQAASQMYRGQWMLHEVTPRTWQAQVSCNSCPWFLKCQWGAIILSRLPS